MESNIQKSVILYDSMCNFCNGVINFILTHDKKDTFLFLPLQTKEARALLRKTNDIFISMKTIYLVENGVSYKRSRAIFRIFQKLPSPWKLLSFLRILPTAFTDYFYNIVARNRYKWFGKRENLALPTGKITE